MLLPLRVDVFSLRHKQRNVLHLEVALMEQFLQGSALIKASVLSTLRSSIKEVNDSDLYVLSLVDF